MNKREKKIINPGIKKLPKITPRRRTDRELSPETWEKGIPGPRPKF